MRFLKGAVENTTKCERLLLCCVRQSLLRRSAVKFTRTGVRYTIPAGQRWSLALGLDQTMPPLVVLNVLVVHVRRHSMLCCVQCQMNVSAGTLTD